MKISYVKPKFFYEKQEAIYTCQTRFTYTMSGNKTGKTFSHCIWINEKCLLGANGSEYAWLAPFFKTAEIAFNLLKKLIKNSTLFKKLEGSPRQFHFNNSKMRITYPNGNILHFFSGENVDSIYGFEISASVVDEASRMKEEAYNALLSTMFATEGPVKLVSNPTIKNNWFYQKWNKLYQMEDRTDGEATAFKLTALDAIAAGIMPRSVFNSAKKNYSTAIFRRDFLAEVPDSETSVFKADKVYENILEKPIDNSLNKVRYLGIDLGFTEGKKSDYTVVTGVDKQGVVRFFKRFKASGQPLIDKLKAYIGDKIAYIDKSGGGITIFELLKHDCKQLEGFTFSNSSKTLVIENLAYYIHADKIKYPNIDALIDELIGYEIDFTKTGKPTYSNGKSVSHDDAVIALGLAVLKYKEQEDRGDLPSGEVYSIDIDEGEGDWQPMQESFEFDYGIY